MDFIFYLMFYDASYIFVSRCLRLCIFYWRLFGTLRYTVLA